MEEMKIFTCSQLYLLSFNDISSAFSTNGWGGRSVVERGSTQLHVNIGMGPEQKEGEKEVKDSSKYKRDQQQQKHTVVTAPKFDPTDKTYQLLDNCKPDKEQTWPYPKEEDGWVHAHNALRAEMRVMIESIEAVENRNKSALEEWQVKCISRAWKAHEDHIHFHHSGEDDFLAPFFKTRFRYPDKMTADHDKIVTQIDVIAKIVGILKAGDNASNLLKELVLYESMMKPHLEWEEVECLPLTRAYFTPEEVGEKVQEMLADAPKVELGSFIHAMGPEKFRKVFMRQAGIPFFVWYIDFMWRLRLFRREFVTPLEAVKNGIKPANMP